MTFENETDRMLDNKWTFPIYIVLMGILACIAYGHLFDHDFSTDDFEHIADVEAILEDPIRLFSLEYHFHGRPLVNIVLLIGYILWGKNPEAYHILTLALHFLVSLRLMQTFRLFGASTTVSMLAGVFFLLYAANFETVQRIATLPYILALIFALEILRVYKTAPLSQPQMLLAAFYMLLGILTHPASVFVLGVCVYIAYTRTESLSETILSTLPSVLVGLIGVSCIYVFYSSAPQVAADWSTSTDVNRYFRYLGHLVLWAFYLPINATDLAHPTPALIFGISFALILLFFVLFRKTPVSIWSLWTLAALVPFFNKALAWRYFYFASAGSAFVLAYFFLSFLTAIYTKISRPLAYTTGIVILVILILSSIFAHKRVEAIALYFTGRAHIARNFFDKGIENLTLALQKNARGIPIDAYQRLSLASFTEGKNPGHILLEGLKHYPDHPQLTPQLNLLFGLSMYLDDTQIIEGKALVQKTYESSANKGKLHALAGTCLGNLAGYYEKNKNYEKAVSMCREALVFQPNQRKALFMLVPLLFKLNRVNEAIQATRQAIDIYPKNKEIALALFLTLIEQKQYAEAEKVYRHYLTLNPQAPNAHYILGTLALAQGRYEETILSLQRAIKDDPDNPDAHLYLAQALEKVGQTQEAMHAYRRVISLDPHNKIATDRLQANE